MKNKILAYKLRTKSLSVPSWHRKEFFYKRIDFFKNNELLYTSEKKEEEYKEIINTLVDIYQNPSVKNIFLLLSKKHLNRSLININIGIDFNIDNHLGQIELMVLQENIVNCWYLMTKEEQDTVINFAKQKTIDTLGSQAECFTLSLKDFTSGLSMLLPEIKHKLIATTQKRRNYYREKIASF